MQARGPAETIEKKKVFTCATFAAHSAVTEPYGLLSIKGKRYKRLTHKQGKYDSVQHTPLFSLTLISELLVVNTQLRQQYATFQQSPFLGWKHSEHREWYNIQIYI